MFRKHTFSYKLSLLFVLVICLPMTALSFFTLTSIKNVMGKNSQELNQSNLKSMANNLNVYFDKYKLLTDSLFISTDIQAVAKAKPSTRIERLAQDRRYQAEITRITINSFELEGTYLFTENGNEYFSHRNYNIDIIRKACQEYVKTEDINNGSYVYVSGAWLSSYANASTAYKALLMRPLYDFSTRAFIGVIVLEFASNVFETLLGYQEDITFVTDKQGHILFDSTGQSSPEESIDSSTKDNPSIPGTVIYKEKNYSMTNIKTKYGWNIVQLVDYSHNNAMLFKPLLPIIWVALGFIAVFVIIAIIMAKRLVAPIRTLQTAMKSVEHGDMMNHVDIRTNDELEDLGNSYNDMLDKLNLFIDKAYNEEILHLDAEYRALQSQINPHFLYNALESISSLAQTTQQPQISRMVCALADMFRYTTRQKDRFVTVSQELDYLKDYFFLQSAGYEDKVISKIAVSSDILNAKIPKMLLQPIVENCFNHALEKSDGTLLITVTGRQTNDEIIFEVTDNGIGIPPDILENLCFHLTHDTTDTSHETDSIGLSNINNRLKIACPAGSKIEVRSKLYNGTQVIIHIFKQGGKYRDKDTCSRR